MNAVVAPKLTQKQMDDMAALFAEAITPDNLSVISRATTGVDVRVENGNQIRDGKLVAKNLVSLLVQKEAVESAVRLLATEFGQNVVLNKGLRSILLGQDLNSDNLQKLRNRFEPFLSTHDFPQVVQRTAAAVCAIAVDDELKGTGFLIGPDLVLTNYHVVEEAVELQADGETVKQFPGTTVCCVFDYLSDPPPTLGNGAGARNPRVVSGKPEWLVYARKKLNGDGTANAPASAGNAYDYAVIRLERAIGERPTRVGGGSLRGWLTLPDKDNDYSRALKIVLFQHPAGSYQQMDIGEVVQYDPTFTRVWYSVNSARGSSGGAAVGSNGQLLALHNASVDSSLAPAAAILNQGVRIDRIATDLRNNVKDWKAPPPPDSIPLGYWSLNDDPDDPQPIIGRVTFRRNVTQAMARDGERVLTVRGEYGTFARFTVALLQRALGLLVPIARFTPSEMASLTPAVFIRALIDRLNITTDPADPMPEVAPATETAERWLGIYLPQWLSRQLDRHAKVQPGAFPAWVAIDVSTPPGTDPLWAQGLRELVTALAGVRDAGQVTDIPQLRWLFLSTVPLPLGNVRRLQEDLTTETNYPQEMAACMDLAWKAVEVQPQSPLLLASFAMFALQANAQQPKEKILSPRRALALCVVELLRNSRQVKII